MTECLNEGMRELLPLLAHATLPATEAARVRAHVTGCAECSAELAVLDLARIVLQANAPRVDVAAITRALGAPTLRVVDGGVAGRSPRRRIMWMPRQYAAAAASLLIVASLSLPFLQRAFGTRADAVLPDTVSVAVPDTAEPGTAASAGLSVTGGLSELTDADLSTLLADLESVQATVASEPAAARAPIVDLPEDE